jgi:hypothetical protein
MLREAYAIITNGREKKILLKNGRFYYQQHDPVMANQATAMTWLLTGMLTAGADCPPVKPNLLKICITTIICSKSLGDCLHDRPFFYNYNLK